MSVHIAAIDVEEYRLVIGQRFPTHPCIVDDDARGQGLTVGERLHYLFLVDSLAAQRTADSAITLVTGILEDFVVRLARQHEPEGPRLRIGIRIVHRRDRKSTR